MKWTLLSVAAWIAMAISSVLLVVGMATDDFLHVKLGTVKHTYNLFFDNKYTLCWGGICYEMSGRSWWVAAQVMVCLGLVAILAATATNLIAHFHKNLDRKLILIVHASCLGVAAALILIGCFVFGANHDDSYDGVPLSALGYSFYIVVVSGLLIGLAAIFNVVEIAITYVFKRPRAVVTTQNGQI